MTEEINIASEALHNDKKVEIFSTPTCHFCSLAKEWFKEKGVKYTEHDVAADIDRRKEMVEMTGQLGVPVIKIGDEIMIGYNPSKMAEILSITL
ncbi:MAG: glutaredoxin family protein [Candidatus Pacebacteria bacterium]|nr:glutaredoxin family protein [Candidatus Paceibacterota bacterium]